MHLQNDHPIAVTRQIIQSRFPSPSYKYHNDLSPVVTTFQNFDSLGFPADHPGRSKADNYYINKGVVLRAHTSAHQSDIFRINQSEGFLISADVYRRDAIDRSHYPIFHQMEGARTWDREKVPGGDVAAAIQAELDALPARGIKVEDPNPTVMTSNPLQDEHTMEEVEAIAAHLKRSLEDVVVEIFSRATAAAQRAGVSVDDTPLKVRWVEAYFPFTSPSWELEIFWQGDWLEVLGCGIVKQDIMIKSGCPSRIGWAFGLGLERIAMLLFNIPDIRLFWSQDQRFLGQFHGLSNDTSALKQFVPFSKYPASFQDVSFWTPAVVSNDNGPASKVPCADPQDFHENDVMEIVREVCGDMVESVTQVDKFSHPKSGRTSLCYRINYRSWEKTLTRREVGEYHEAVGKMLVNRLGVELRL